MSMYSSKDGFMIDSQLVHLGSYALHGAGLVFAEASAAESRGRITPGCAGVYSDDHIPANKRVVDFVHSAGGKISVQLIHTERKYVMKAFGAAAVRADKAGMDTVEIQGAYGYLIHTFFSPLTNHRTDKYRGSLEHRARLLLKVVREVCANFSAEKPIFQRLSVPDCVEYLSNIPSFVIEEAVQVARWAKDAGLDIIHVVAVGHTPREKIPRFPDYLVHYAAQIRQDVPGLAVIAVCTINSGKQAQEIVESGKADLVAAASVFLKHPTFALDAGRELGVDVTYAPLHPCRYA
ncbi:NADH:flavin oxidoreductase [Linnemannia elongata]|nr:NADH:flavin oxidoreductase [Linnemannia elongata]